MIEIKDLLARFENLLLSEESKKQSIARSVGSAINLEISARDIEIKNNIVYLNIKPIYKSEIMLKREKIDLSLKDLLGAKSPTNIH